MILIDNTVLSNFALTGNLQFLRTYCAGQGLTTRAVDEEFQKGVERNLFAETDISWIRKTDLRSRAEKTQFQRLLSGADAGEASCLSVAMHRNHRLLTDDLNARQLTRWEDISVSGSVGVLVSLVNASVISLEEGNQILRAFIGTGYFSPVEVLDNLV